MNKEKIVYTVPEVASLLGISKSHAYKLARDGIIPSFKLGTRCLIPKEVIDKLLNVA